MWQYVKHGAHYPIKIQHERMSMPEIIEKNETRGHAGPSRYLISRPLSFLFHLHAESCCFLILLGHHTISADKT